MKRHLRLIATMIGALGLAACQSGSGGGSVAPRTIGSGEVRFTPPDCDYSVAFPAEPELGRADGSERYIALLQEGEGARRAVYYSECLAEGGIQPQRAAQLLAGLLRAEGVENASATDFATEAGTGWSATGSSVIDGVAFRHEFVLVPGPRSALLLGISSAVQHFPPDGRDSFLDSIERQDSRG